jgi:hypothetical protein
MVHYLNKVMEFKCITYIILGYLHSPWNVKRYYITLSKPKRNIIHAPYYDNILNHDTNEIIIKLITLMVINNKTMKIMRVMHVHIKILLNKTLYHQCGQYCNTFMYIDQRFCIGPFMNLKMSLYYINVYLK